MQEEDNHLFMINKDSQPCFQTVADRNRDPNSINCYNKWDQAFKVFLNIFLDRCPGKVGELLQYNHVIQTTAYTYPWDNVYRYDKEFRVHISKHPSRTWAVTLQQAWNTYMRDKDRCQGGGSTLFTPSKSDQLAGRRKKLCYSFNSGWCTYGS